MEADAVAAPADNAQPAAAGGLRNTIMNMAKQLLIFYVISNVIKGFTGGGGRGKGGEVVPSGPSPSYGPGRNMYRIGQHFDMHIYLSDQEGRFDAFSSESPFWLRRDLTYGDWNTEETFSTSIPTPPALTRNASLFLHLFIVRAGRSPDPADSKFDNVTIYHSKRLNRFRRKFYKRTANLLTGESEQSEEDLRKADEMKHEVLNFWHPTLTISFIFDQTQFTKGAIPSPLSEALEFDATGSIYKPIVHLNDYWNLAADYHPVNESTKEINVSLTYQPMSMLKYQLYASQKMRSKWAAFMPTLDGEGSEDEAGDDMDAMKQALLETSPILLAITGIVSMLHTVFEFFAFKNDIQFWKTRNNLAGLSVRSVLWGVGQSLIVFFYICDNDTNFVVKASVFVGLLIECWKVPKCMDVEILWNEPRFLGFIPRVSFKDKGSYVESETKEYDRQAFEYLSWFVFPMLGCYAVYSLMYVEQRGWYSWVLSMLYGFLLTFGFIMMCPQLFINYKLKSVAHLPWRMLTYKFINTFIDDLFAFVIRMPVLYRLGCFRDDIVFLVYLYQWWAYGVDKKRVNEYGVTGEENPSIENAESEEMAETPAQPKSKGDKKNE